MGGEPVEIAGTSAATAPSLPSRIIEPLPNCFSIWPIARSIALSLSVDVIYASLCDRLSKKFLKLLLLFYAYLVFYILLSSQGFSIVFPRLRHHIGQNLLPMI